LYECVDDMITTSFQIIEDCNVSEMSEEVQEILEIFRKLIYDGLGRMKQIVEKFEQDRDSKNLNKIAIQF
jgi:hypothetical protein